jgi:hypothetical protein
MSLQVLEFLAKNATYLQVTLENERAQRETFPLRALV